MTNFGASLPSSLILHSYTTNTWSTKLDIYNAFIFVVDFDDKTTMKLAKTDNWLSYIVQAQENLH